AAPRASLSATPSGNGTSTALARDPEVALARYASFPAVVELIRANRDVKLLLEVESHIRLVHYAPGRIEFEPTPDAPRDLAATLAQRLQSWTGVRWGVSVVSEGGAKTIAEERNAREDAAREKARGNPLVQAVFAAFPKASITAIRTPDEVQAEAQAEALPEVEDEWDPFEEG
ncbi:MAG: DNA polymerase III subunit gamma/tau, partial [Albidovulum sp.]